jgi:hypothetical protein
MSFELRVDFAGICIYVRHPERNQVAVLMPDARKGRVDLVHEDELTGKEAEPHAGYLRFDLASLGAGAGLAVPGGEDDDGPAFEGVHRFDRQVLHFGMDEVAGTGPANLHLPDFGTFAPTLEPRPDLFSKDPATLLMRTTLKGGTLTTVPGKQNWGVPMRLHPNAPYPLHQGFFAGTVRWVAEVPGAEITVTVANFDGTAPARLVLRPVQQPDGKMAVRLKVANLCCNALEWEWVSQPDGRGPDVDFKWLYRLLQPESGTYAMLLNRKKFPVPEEIPPLLFGGRHCVGGKMSFAFPEEPGPDA